MNEVDVEKVDVQSCINEKEGLEGDVGKEKEGMGCWQALTTKEGMAWHAFATNIDCAESRDLLLSPEA